MDGELELLFLHALPLDGSMWHAHMQLLPGKTHAPTLYGFGDNLGAWAASALALTTSKRLILIGCSVGGSCALEIAALVPERVAALVLIGTKVACTQNPETCASILQKLRIEGMEKVWTDSWEQMFSPMANPTVVEHAKTIALRQHVDDIANGVSVFHCRPSREDLLPTLYQPVVFVSGKDDTAPGPARTAQQSTCAPNSRLHLIPDCGHYVPLERPEALKAIIKDLIRQLSCSA